MFSVIDNNIQSTTNLHFCLLTKNIMLPQKGFSVIILRCKYPSFVFKLAYTYFNYTFFISE